jgi:glycine/D-amino acid oxidase-like deaminating enzyme
MNVSNEKSVSLWMGTTVLKDAPALDKKEKADVAIIGSGIAGLSVAYELTKAGKSVVVLDRGPIGKGMTSRTTAHLTAQCDDGFDLMIKRRGEDLTKAWYQSQVAGIDRIEANIEELGIDCDFRRLDGHLFHAEGTDEGIIGREFEATRKVGMEVHREKGVPFVGQAKTSALRYPNQATFHPLKYLAGIAAAIQDAGGRFYADTIVQELKESDDDVEIATASGHRVLASHAVVATNAPINDRYAIHSKQAPYRTYAMAFSVPKDTLPDGLYWDTLEAYHYVRLQPGRGKTDVLIVGHEGAFATRVEADEGRIVDGIEYLARPAMQLLAEVGQCGADHKSGEADDADARFLALEAWMRNLRRAIQAKASPTGR